MLSADNEALTQQLEAQGSIMYELQRTAIIEHAAILDGIDTQQLQMETPGRTSSMLQSTAAVPRHSRRVSNTSQALCMVSIFVAQGDIPKKKVSSGKKGLFVKATRATTKDQQCDCCLRRMTCNNAPFDCKST